MSDEQRSFHHGDIPIGKPVEDILGRKGYAKQLADRIAGWRGDESLVVGIYGEWGDGKTSLKNLVLHYMEERGAGCPESVEFNPWMVSGEESITRAFFAEVAAKLDKGADEGKEQRKKAWKKYARYLNLGSQVAGAVQLSGLLVPGLSLFGGSAKKLLEKGRDLAASTGECLEAAEVSLSQIKAELRESFRKLDKPILVVIDDIDRLTSDEIRLVFRLVKANADLPNLLYLLLFQRVTVETALNDITNNEGHRFLEKIVNMGFDLPTPSMVMMRFVLEGLLDSQLRQSISEEDFDQERWRNLWVKGIGGSFTNLRAVYRFFSSFEFQLSGLSFDGGLEVDPVDFIAVEWLRVFEPEVFREISGAKAIITGVIDRLDEDRCKALEKQILEKRRGEEACLRYVLRTLFPGLDAVWENQSYSSSIWRNWARQRRVCADEFFDRYFTFGLAEGELSESTVRGLIDAASNRAALRESLERLIEEGSIRPALMRLEHEQHLEEAAEPLPYLLGLADVSDRLSDESPGIIEKSEFDFVYGAIHRSANAKRGPERSALLKRIVEETVSLSIAARIISDLNPSDPPEDDWPPKLEEAEWAILRDAWVERVNRIGAEDAESLLGLPRLSAVLRRWKDWGGESCVHAWVEAISDQSVNLVRFLRAFIAKSSSQTLGSAHERDLSWISWVGLLKVASKEFWLAQVEPVSALDSLNPPEARARELFLEAMKRMEDGVADDDPMKFQR